MTKPSDTRSSQPVSGSVAEQLEKGMKKQEGAQHNSGGLPTLSGEERKKLEDDVARETEEQAKKADAEEARTAD